MASLDATLTEDAQDNRGLLLFKAKFQGNILEIPPLDKETSILDLKRYLADETSVPIQRQKLIGLIKGKLPPDNTLLGDIINTLKPNQVITFTLMGTPDDKLFIDPSDRDDLPEIFDDFKYDYETESKRWHRSKRNARKLEEFTARTEINWINEPRPGKKLLVLDLDRTLLDFSRHDDDPSAAAKRPFMDQFLIDCYPHYDLVIWSATSWRWLEIKLTELGMLSHPQYKLCCVLDKTSMFRIVSDVNNNSLEKKEEKSKDKKSNKSRKLEANQIKHSVKPLEILWKKFPKIWNQKNTVHVDDLSRNFALNPKNGIQCSPFRRHSPTATLDNELQLISFYLVHIATSPPINKKTSSESSSSASSSSSSSLASSSSSASSSHLGASDNTPSSNSSSSSSNGVVNLLLWDHEIWRETVTAIQLGNAFANK